MKSLILVFGLGAVMAALLAALGGAVRPLLLTSLLSDQHWPKVIFGAASPAGWFDRVPTIYAVLSLELIEAIVLLGQGVALTYLAMSIGRTWRTKLTRAVLHSMAGGSDETTLGRYVALSTSYVNIIELFHRQYFIPSIAAVLQLMFAIFVAATVSLDVAVLLLAEVVCLVGMTIVYARIQVKLAQQRLETDERLLAGTALNPRKGIAIWFGGTGALWFRTRIKEIKALTMARRRLGIADVAYLNAVTLTVGLFVVAGFFVIVEWQHREKSIFLAYLLYSGLMVGPVLRTSSFIPECREYFLARDALRDAVLNAPHREQKLRSTDLIAFSTADKRTNERGSLEKLEIGPGDRIALIGASGSGKTTTIEALLGARVGVLDAPLIAHHPSHSVRLELPHVGVRYLTEAPVFEAGTILMNCQTTLAECQRIVSMFGLYPGLNDNELVSFFGRSILASGEPLSLGERQRVQFIRALAAKPKALILDEALSGVEEDLEHQVISTLIEDGSVSTLIYVGHRRSIQELFDRKIQI